MTADAPPPRIEPSELVSRIADRFRVSGLAGSRIPLESRVEVVPDGDGGQLRFVVRVLAPHLRRAAAKPPASARSPFLPPYDPDLLVGAISPTHVCLLNKYNVVDRHVLIVTRELEEQNEPLTPADFEAAWTCLGAVDGLVFYNSGPTAGASQPHKHLQLVPFPLGPGTERFPLASSIGESLAAGRDRVACFAFRHRLAPTSAARDAAEQALDTYRAMLEKEQLARAGIAARPAPHNLLMTREWMLVVPRWRESCGEVEVNALGFAGALMARSETGLAAIRSAGPLEVLRSVAAP